MKTLVISDLHLGTASGNDLLRRPEVRAALAGALDGIDRLVLLGDVLELREVPVRDAAALARPLLEAAGAALGAEGEIVIVPGNHDHAILGPWFDERLGRPDPPPLGLEQRIAPEDAGPLARTLAAAAGPARVSFAYPGLRLRDDVYALHGHYADLHSTIPTMERLFAGAMMRWAAPFTPGERATPDDYEACLAPIYAWIDALIQYARPGIIHANQGASARTWARMTHGRRRSLRARLLTVGFAGAVEALNRAGVGPLRRDLSGAALRQGYLNAIGEAVRRLGIEADHVIWGHSHRAGPFPADDLSEWRTPTGARIHNTGSWVHQRHFLTDEPGGGPYAAGTAILVEDDGPPVLRRLLEGPA
jgi:predicted phosphodiesterase